MGMLGLILAVALVGGAHSQVVPPVTAIESDPYGDCLSEAGPMEMDAVLFLRNDRLRIGGGAEARIHLETVYISQIDRLTYVPVDAEISSEEDLDIQLEFALLGGELHVYWRETYRNRLYRQGLFRIEPHADLIGRLVYVCEGRGGEVIAH